MSWTPAEKKRIAKIEESLKRAGFPVNAPGEQPEDEPETTDET